MASEHGYYYQRVGTRAWEKTHNMDDFSWKEVATSTLKHYTESTDGSSIEVKDSAIVWHYRDADPDFGSWQVEWFGACLWLQASCLCDRAVLEL